MHPVGKGHASENLIHGSCTNSGTVILTSSTLLPFDDRVYNFDVDHCTPEPPPTIAPPTIVQTFSPTPTLTPTTLRNIEQMFLEASNGNNLEQPIVHENAAHFVPPPISMELPNITTTTTGAPPFPGPSSNTAKLPPPFPGPSSNTVKVPPQFPGPSSNTVRVPPPFPGPSSNTVKVPPPLPGEK